VAAHRTDRPQPLPRPLVQDSDWEPDGVTLQVRFCEESGAEPSHDRDSVAPPGNQAANREHQLLSKRRQGPGLLSPYYSHHFSAGLW
jgi:hypothetical protein